MTSVRLEFSLRHIPWRVPLRAAHGGEDPGTRALILVRVEDEHGASGYGEAAPLAGYDGVGIDDVMHALGIYQLILRSMPRVDHTAILRACLAAAPLPQAIAAVDMALWDLEGRRTGRPVWELLGGRARPELEVNATIGAEDPLMAGAEAAAAVGAGFANVKVKVGVGEDLARVAAVRSAIGDVTNLRIDANGAWSVTEAVMALNKLEECGIEYCEEPVHGIEQLMAVCDAAPAVPVAADESAAEPTFYNDRACHAVCLKVARCGGITGILRDHQRSREHGYQIYLASTLDGPLGIAAALHAAAVFEPDAASGLATLSRLEGPDVIPVDDGYMLAPLGPGLGDGLLEWY